MKRRDGHLAIIPKEYWVSVRNVQPVNAYNKLAAISQLLIICASQDEAIRVNKFPNLNPNIEIISIDADHNFLKREVREQLVAEVRRFLTSASDL